jgi:hypothetical protein
MKFFFLDRLEIQARAVLRDRRGLARQFPFARDAHGLIATVLEQPDHASDFD